MTDAQSPGPDITGTVVTDPLNAAEKVSQELLSRLRVIEEQPLSTRADAYASLHDELAARLESAPPR